ncbi:MULTISPECIES: hypothetical protein [Campylobacter]|jgi:putative membrane-bound tetrahaem cytochrome torC/yecK|uniref:hypothetical protein n=1 Tax=Campylobacter TaxID=194 RepID=UPI00027A3A3B|nr:MULTISPECIES: hypothetical protein [Campylobacter]EJP76228.1 hypothetical protein HMPREF1139_1888 [Campylobacter sp. FOBRC14]
MKVLFLLLSCFLGGALALCADFINTTSEISLDGKKIGKIEVLTPVEVVSKDGKTAKVKVKGVVSESYQEQIQRDMKNAEIFVVFDAQNEKNFTKAKKLEDDYGEVWYEAQGVYDVPSDVITGDANALYKQAKQIYEGTCSACHRLHEPNSFTANQWPANLQGMIDAGYVALEENDLNLILKYLQHNAKAAE